MPEPTETPLDVLVDALIEEYGADRETWLAMRSARRVLNKVTEALARERQVVPGVQEKVADHAYFGNACTGFGGIDQCEYPGCGRSRFDHTADDEIGLSL